MVESRERLHVHLYRRIRKIVELWPPFFCLTTWFFIVLAGVISTDFFKKYYGMSLAMILVMVRLNEKQLAAEDDKAASMLSYTY
jgi:hypothetical protein